MVHPIKLPSLPATPATDQSVQSVPLTPPTGNSSIDKTTPAVNHLQSAIPNKNVPPPDTNGKPLVNTVRVVTDKLPL